MKLIAATAALLLGMVQGLGNSTCGGEFVMNCRAAPDESTCKTCTAGLDACGNAEKAVIDIIICRDAPFPPALECAGEIAIDCAVKATSPLACEGCLLLHTRDLKKYECNATEIGVASALCTKIPHNSSSY